MAESAEEIRKHVRVYILVFAALAVLTVATVGVSYIQIESVAAAVLIALFIASIKAGLVAGYFMHLVSEKRIIFWVLALTVAFFAVLMLLPSITEFSGAGEMADQS